MIYNAQLNPYLGAAGTATMHGDAQSSDATPLAGPGAGEWDIRKIQLGGACPTVLAGSDGLIQVLMTQRISASLVFLQPRIVILDPATGTEIAGLNIPKGALLGGVYAYLDDRDRMVLADGSNMLIRVAHSPDGSRLWVEERVGLSAFLAGDQVVGLTPDWSGNVWVATGNARVGVIAPDGGTIAGISLGPDETIDNSISAAPDGVSIVTSRAIYLLTADEAGRPTVLWREPYDHGSHRKPGKLSPGSGATPTFFGPGGSDFLMLTDNGDEQERLRVHRTADGTLLGEAPLFTPGRSGTENSTIGVGTSIFCANTWGYPYPRYPEGAGESVPRSGVLAPGVERWDLGEGGLRQVWSRADIYNAAVPRLSTADGIIYTTQRPPLDTGSSETNGASITALALDSHTGATLHEQPLPGLVTLFGGDTLQMVGTIDAAGTWWQGHIGGIFRISRKDAR